jgi:hypothetical protein
MPTNWKASELYCSRPLWKDIPRNSSYSAAGSASKSTKSTTERENPLKKESPQTKSHSAAIVANKGDLRAEEILEMQKREHRKGLSGWKMFSEWREDGEYRSLRSVYYTC